MFMVHRIRALQSFDNVEKGDLGGYIGCERNLSQRGNCWVDKDSVVSGDGRVENEAQIVRSFVYDSIVSGHTPIYDSVIYKSIIEDCANIKCSSILESRVSSDALIVDSLIKNDSWITGKSKISNGCNIIGSRIFADSVLSNIGVTNGSIGTRGFVLDNKNSTKIMLVDVAISSYKEVLYIPFFNHSRLTSVLFYKTHSGNVKVWYPSGYSSDYNSFKYSFRNQYTENENRTVDALISLVDSYFELERRR